MGIKEMKRISLLSNIGHRLTDHRHAKRTLKRKKSQQPWRVTLQNGLFC